MQIVGHAAAAKTILPANFTHYFTLITVWLLLLETTASSDLKEIEPPQK